MPELDLSNTRHCWIFDAGDLSAKSAAAWLRLIIRLSRVWSIKHRLVLAAGLKNTLQPSLLSSLERLSPEWADDLPDPSPDDDFVLLTSSACLSRKLFSCFNRIFLAPNTIPTKIHAELAREYAVPSLSVDHLDAGEAEGRLDPFEPVLALVTSIYAGDRFLPGFLENMADLEGYEGFEHFLVRAGSPGHEADCLIRHASAHEHAVVINLSSDPGLYEVWNLCCQLAQSPFLSNANIDDRRCSQHAVKLLERLASYPAASVASSALWIDDQNRLSGSSKDVLFGGGIPAVYGHTDLVKTASGQLQPRCIPHCMPIWRRSLHAQFGYFDEPFAGPSADWEFWLRVGSQGTLFAHVEQPLGTYLKRDDSYWGRNDSESAFDQRILQHYFPDGINHTASSSAAGRPLSYRLSLMARLGDMGAWAELVFQLCGTAQQVSPDNIAAIDLLNAYGRRYLAIDSVFSLFQSRPAMYRPGLSPADAVFLFLADYLRAGSKGTETLDRTAFARRSRQVFIDIWLMTRDVRALVGLAYSWRLLGEVQREEAMLRLAFNSGATAFWYGWQQVYRFEQPLDAVVRLLPTGMQAEGGSMRVPDSVEALWFYPDYRRSNHYQRLLYEPLIREGVTVRSFRNVADMLQVDASHWDRVVVHLHWVHEVVETPGVELAQQKATELLLAVESLKAGGATIWWTVHNRLSHSARHPEVEWWLRGELAKIVDRVYLHHPMVIEQLSWLPEGTTPYLQEHVAYRARGLSRNQLSARENVGLKPSDTVMLLFGAMKPYKDLPRQMDAIHPLLAQHQNFKIIIAGKISDPALRDFLDSHNHPRIFVNDRFIPNLELAEYLRACDFVWLSYREILTSGSLFQALAFDRACLVPVLGTLPGYVIPGVNGMFYRDKASLRAAAELLISTQGLRFTERAEFQTSSRAIRN